MAVKAGFYADPDTAGQLRYWDGRQWTTTIQPTPLPTKPPFAFARMLLIILAVLAVIVVLVLVLVFSRIPIGD